METRLFAAACMALAAGCASAGGGSGPEVAPVPVYVVGQTVPCEYEVIRTLRRSSAVTPSGATSFAEMRAEILGQAGAEIGADAVVVEPPPTGVQGRRSITGGPPRAGVEFEGRAIRFLPGTCR